MASLIPGYEYDIFISYRQKDNKHNGWVTEFVDILKGELEATFKEDICVYFDINPHDGLLETHDVDASLEEKLKCLIFIPIISRTYCDPKSFAWEHEFKAFVDLALKDKFGLKVKLPNGNVASRVLPVQIHDLDIADIKLCELILEGVLRGIEFIYEEPGVNRPLTVEDDENKNLKRTRYRNQVNKVALAINEIIRGMETKPEWQKFDKRIEKEELMQTEEVLVKKNNEKRHKRFKRQRKFVLSILGLAALMILGIFVYPRLFKQSEQKEKSIAVLPFKLLSDEPDKQYLADGMMDAITLHLSKIKDLRVMMGTSMEQYRHLTKTTKAVGRELGVEYLLEGSFQKFGDDVRLIIHLIKTGKKGYVWVNNYDRKWNSVFAVQSEVAQTIARELQAVITPEEKQLIEKTPTANLKAYDYYLKANEILKEYKKTRDLSFYHTAVNSYKTALKADPVYAKAYTGLANAYYQRYQWENYFKEYYIDSVLVLAERALSIDNQLDEAYYMKGLYSYVNGQIEEASINFDKALRINPNYYMAYVAKGGKWTSTDFVGSIINYQKALSLISGNERPSLLRDLALIYTDIGFLGMARKYYKEALELDGDSATFFSSLAFVEFSNENFENAILFDEKAYEIDSTKLPDLVEYNITGQDKKANIFAEKHIELLNISGSIPLTYSHRLGYSFWKVYKFKEAKHYFDNQIKYSTESIELSREYGITKSAQYDLAAVYAFRGEKTKAFQYLNDFNTLNIYPLWWIVYAKYDPLFASIRKEEKFQNILHYMEAKYQAEHERVRKWLEEQGML